MSTKRPLDEEEESVERVLTITSALNKEDNDATRVINSSSYGCHGTVSGKPIDMGNEDISHDGNRMTTSSDRSKFNQIDDEIREWSTDAKDQVMHKVYRPWKRMKHVEQVHESRQ